MKEIAAIKKLTKREQEIGVFLIKGMAPKEIAYTLRLSLHTVQSHQKSIKKKLNSKTMCQLGALLSSYLGEYGILF